MGLIFPALPGADSQKHGATFAVAGAVHAAALALLLTGTTERLAAMARPIAVRLIELAPTPPESPPPPPAVKPPPRLPLPARATVPPPVLAAASETPSTFAVPPAPTVAPPVVAAIPAPPAPAAPSMEPPLTAARFDAAYLANPKPAYPPASRRLGEEGRVVLRVRVSADGRAEQVEVRESSGYARLDAAARDAVGHWRFVPARRGEQAVAAWVLVPLVFNLES